MAKRTFDVITAAKNNGRFEFIALFLVAMTARKVNRLPCNGMQVRSVDGGYVCGWLDIARGPTLDARGIYENARRSPLNYWVQRAEELRIDILSV